MKKGLDQAGFKSCTSYVREILYHIDMGHIWECGVVESETEFIKEMKKNDFSQNMHPYAKQ